VHFFVQTSYAAKKGKHYTSASLIVEIGDDRCIMFAPKACICSGA
jgi:hypothetical protein